MTYMHKTLIAAAIAACAVAAQADPTVTIDFDSPIFSGTEGDTVQYRDTVTITYPKLDGTGSTSLQVYAGRFQGTASNLVGIEAEKFVDSIDNVWMFCYDIYETIGNGQTVIYSINFDGAEQRTLVFLAAVNAVLGASDPYAWLRPTTAAEAAAIQLGIWESLYDTDWDIKDGNFSANGFTSDTDAALTSFFGAIDVSVSLDQRYTMVLEAKGAQDMITGDPPPPPGNSVPEPGTLSLLLASAGALALGRRRRRS